MLYDYQKSKAARRKLVFQDVEFRVQDHDLENHSAIDEEDKLLSNTDGINRRIAGTHRRHCTRCNCYHQLPTRKGYFHFVRQPEGKFEAYAMYRRLITYDISQVKL